jgi:hypothetical protein
MDSFLSDLRYAARTMRRNPTLVIAAVLCLAFGIGANTTEFTAMQAIAIHPVPTRHSDRLVIAGEMRS